MNNAVQSTMNSYEETNPEIYDTSGVTNENVKAFIEAKKESNEINQKMQTLKDSRDFYYVSEGFKQEMNDLRDEAKEANNAVNEAASEIDLDSLSTEDYAACVNAACGKNNKNGLKGSLEDKITLQLTMDKMSKEEITKAFDEFMTNEEKAKFLEKVAQKNPEYIPDQKTVDAYVDEAYKAFIEKKPRVQLTNDMATDFALYDTVKNVHKTHTAEAAKTTEANKNLSTRFAGMSNPSMSGPNGFNGPQMG